MRKNNTLLWALLLIAALSGSDARAQGLAGMTQMTDSTTGQAEGAPRRPGYGLPMAVESRLSAKEHRYSTAVAEAFGSRLAQQERVVQRYSSESNPNEHLLARGVQVGLSDGTTVERFRFANGRDAFDYATYGANLSDAGADALLEVRGKQVVVIRGKGLDDPARSRRAFDAAWNDALPTPAGAPSATATFLADNGGFVLVTRDDDPVLDEQFRTALDKTHERVEAHQEGFTRLGDAHYSFAFPSGAAGQIQHGPGPSMVLFGKTPAAREQLAEHLARAIAQDPTTEEAPSTGGPGAALEGATGVLGGLFD